ncbi:MULTISPECIES: sugar phosphate isomerase/epimerase [Cryobacterium]|uniref:Sugar phosphate isomerase/epimerase n=1 Tax=Cryobacterium glucosi TaxID=1259175 RepID=A0ABY2IQ81_9MICO|nr:MULTISPECIES: sugar phosphate isomerase/epimerase [Cryobacterium]TFB98836.1 sugar phosphate isomerase/epimerase [Cryobacterium sp. MDB2-A-1]TFC04248.1 sugar phosphate isomerase/epimerase [Cryobacterium sp. MDB2-33-2]TFC14913.1 sugar phosphate isomerase/epimerase [Cryobacterium sp. MDB2-A-2]TFC16421.1 sugar phosphate isomerase/epimerase [Cryobacterium sp. MDB2-10]TFC21146.1 sugar phosphate isomerase/epimerase [Cryobacterium glucosi]
MTINFGARGHDVTWASTPEELARGLAGYGVHNVQLALGRSFPELSGARAINPGLGAYFRRVMAAQGVDIAVLGCYDNIIHPDADRREAILRKFEAYLRNARHFGAPMVATETGSVNADGFAYTRANFTDEAYREAATVIRRLAEFGERVGTIVAIEPGINHPIYNLDRVEQLLDDVDSPFLGIVFDATALLDPNEPVDLAALTNDAFERFGGRIVAAHLDDYRLSDGRVVRCDIDDGVLPVARILATIGAHAPGLAVIMEETVNDAIARTVDRYTESGFSK